MDTSPYKDRNKRQKFFILVALLAVAALKLACVRESATTKNPVSTDLMSTKTSNTSNTRNIIRAVRRVSNTSSLSGQPGIDLELMSPRPFPSINDIPILVIGQQTFTLSHYPTNGDTHFLIFTLTSEEFNKTRPNDLVVLRYQSGRPDRVWNFGVLGQWSPLP